MLEQFETIRGQRGVVRGWLLNTRWQKFPCLQPGNGANIGFGLCRETISVGNGSL